MKRNAIRCFRLTDIQPYSSLIIQSWGTLERPITIESSGLKTHRSAFAVSRHIDSECGVCLRGLTVPIDQSLCNCTALLTSPSPSFLSPEKVFTCDDFSFAIALSNIGEELETIVKPSVLTGLMGKEWVHPILMPLCSLPEPNIESVAGSTTSSILRVRLFLTTEEEHRVTWMCEDNKEWVHYANRLRSFRSLYVCWKHTLEGIFSYPKEVHTSNSAKYDKRGSFPFYEPLSRPLRLGKNRKDLNECKILEPMLRDIHNQMISHHIPCSMSDYAVLREFSHHYHGLESFYFSLIENWLNGFREKIALRSPPNSVISAESSSEDITLPYPPDMTCQYVFMLIVLINHLTASSRVLKDNITPISGVITSSSSWKILRLSQYALEIGLSVPLTSVPEAWRSAVTSLRKNFLEVLGTCDILPTSPDGILLTGWLLRTYPAYSVTARYLHIISAKSVDIALHLLQENGLYTSGVVKLDSFLEVTLPLLDATGDTVLFARVMRGILGDIERQTRHHSQFSEINIKFLVRLGNWLFRDLSSEKQSAESKANGVTPLEKSEELFEMSEVQVMEGGPWAICQYLARMVREVVLQFSKQHQVSSNSPSSQGNDHIYASTTLSNDFANCSDENKPISTHTHVSSNNSGSIEISEPNGVFSITKGPLLSISYEIKERFIAVLEQVVENHIESYKSAISQPALYQFILQNAVLPNIHDQYRRRLFLLMNVSSTESSDDVPTELRYLVHSLPLILSPWSGGVILRDALQHSAGNNARYTFVLNAALDLQLPISETRSRIARTVSMWRFLNTQSMKLSEADLTRVKRRCFTNLPLSYILTSYTSLLGWFCIVIIIILNVMGLDLEARYVAHYLSRSFTQELESLEEDEEATASNSEDDAMGDFLQKCVNGNKEEKENMRDSEEIETLLSKVTSVRQHLTSFLYNTEGSSGLTVVHVLTNPDPEVVSNDLILPYGGHNGRQYAKLSSRVACILAKGVIFPFYIPLEYAVSLDELIHRLAAKIRRQTTSAAWGPYRMLFRIFPLGRKQTEWTLWKHTCSQAVGANSSITLILHLSHGAVCTEKFIRRLAEQSLKWSVQILLITPSLPSLKAGNSEKNSWRTVTYLPSPLEVPHELRKRKGWMEGLKILFSDIDHCKSIIKNAFTSFLYNLPSPPACYQFVKSHMYIF